MKAENVGLQRLYGEIVLLPESVDDLWHLQHLVPPGSLVYATTLRSVDSASDKIRPDKMEKRPVRLGIRVERVEFHEYALRLRVSGMIEDGIDTGAHHTLNLETGYEISVIRNWHQADLDRIERAVKGSASESVHILAIEEGEAELYRIHSFGPREIYSLSLGSGKGAETESRQAFYEQITGILIPLKGPLVIAGPGFIKDDFATRLRAASPDRAGVVVAETRRSGRGAVQEVIGQGILEKISGDLQLAREVRCMDELFRRIGTGGAVAYGYDEVKQAIEYGAVETMMVADSLIRNPETEKILEEAEELRADIIILSTEFEPGERLEKLGGYGALLRYPIA